MTVVNSAQADMLANMRAMTQQAQGQKPTHLSSAGGEGEHPSFSTLMKSAIDHVNQTQQTADTLQTDYLMGKEGSDLVSTVLATQKANLTFQTTQQIRNKLLSAFREMMNQQV